MKPIFGLVLLFSLSQDSFAAPRCLKRVVSSTQRTREMTHDENQVRAKFLEIIADPSAPLTGHYGEFNKLRQTLGAEGYSAGPIEVLTGEYTYRIEIPFQRVDPKRPGKIELISFELQVVKNDPELPAQNFRVHYFGSVDRAVNPIERAKQRQSEVEAFAKEVRPFGVEYFNSTKSYAWVQHMRAVQKNIVIPLALKDPTILEVSLGFDKEADIRDGKTWGLPEIRVYPSYALINAGMRLNPAFEKLYANLFDGVSVQPAIGKPFEIVQADPTKYLLVSDEMSDRVAGGGELYLIERSTGKQVSLEIDEPSQSYVVAGSAPGRPVESPSFKKINDRLKDRIRQLHDPRPRARSNPRIHVRIWYTNQPAAEAIFSVSEIEKLIKENYIVKISEYSE